MTLWQIDPGYFCAGLVVRDGRVVLAAPILGWAVGKPWVEVRAWAERQHARLTRVAG